MAESTTHRVPVRPAYLSPSRRRRVALGASLAAVVMISAVAGPGVSNGAVPSRDRALRVTITGQNHAPIANKRWKYAVKVSDAQGRRLSGTETTYYTYGGSVVGTEKPVNVHFRNGLYTDTIIFPPAAIGHPLAVKAVVKTSEGTGSASWSITVKA